MTAHCIPVTFADRSYHIDIAPGLLTSGRAIELLAALAPNRRICVVTHPALYDPYVVPLLEGLAAHEIHTANLTIPPGEHTKRLGTVNKLYKGFLDAGLDRTGLILAVGGGVLGDMVGFAAATFLRGLRFVQIPTTLLAQVDASVGGKTGVDLPEGKNLVGAFHQPSAVLIDPHTLRTLPARELRAGLAEVIKYGIISDKAFFYRTVKAMPDLLNLEEEALTEAITRSCEIKAEVVMDDETEQGRRAILNFGHTVGHALETVTGYRRYRHGEAIAIGMVAAALIGEEVGITPPIVTHEVCTALRAARLPVTFPSDIDADTILELARRDKKTIAGHLRFVLAWGIGEVVLMGDVSPDAVRKAIERQKSLQ